MSKLNIYFASAGTPLINKKNVEVESKFGHVWFSIEDGTSQKSFGWSSGNSEFVGGKDNFEDRDSKSKERPIAVMSMEITQQQAFDLEMFARRISEGQRVDGFGPNYNVFTNNCIHFVAQALIEAGLLGKDFKVENNHVPITQMHRILGGLQDRHLAQGHTQHVENLRWYSQTREGVQTTHKEIKKILDVQAQTLTIQDEKGTKVKDLREPVTYQDGDAWVHLMNNLGLNISVGDIRLPDDPSWDQMQDLQFRQPYSDPIILDLDGDGIQTLGQIVQFDHGGDGFAELTGWVAPGDGLLARDLNQDGKIDKGSELFGNYARLKNGKFAEHGFALLKDLDENQDGVLDAQDPVWGELLVWQDRNADGVSEEGELGKLNELASEIQTKFEWGSVWEKNGNFSQMKAKWTDLQGQQHEFRDFWFSSTFWKTRGETGTGQGIPVLPTPGTLGRLEFGRSDRLDAAIRAYVAEEQGFKRTALMEELLQAWGDVYSDRDYVYDYTKDLFHMYGMESMVRFAHKFLGNDHIQSYDLSLGMSGQITYKFEQIRDYYMALWDTQTHDQKYYQSLKLVWNGQSFDLDASGIVAQLKTLYEADRMQGITEIARLGNRLTNLENGDKILQALAREAQNETEFDHLLQAMPGSIVGSARKDYLYGNDGPNILVGLGGEQDFLSGDGGDDFLVAGDKSNSVSGGQGNDTIFVGTGSGQAYGNEGNDVIIKQGGGGSMYGNEGNDRLVLLSNSSGECLDGGTGSDDYVIGRHFGRDHIGEYRRIPEDVNRLIFPEHKAEDLWFRRPWSDLQITTRGQKEDLLHIKDWKYWKVIDEIQTGDGKRIKADKLDILVEEMNKHGTSWYDANMIPDEMMADLLGNNTEFQALWNSSWETI